MPEHKFFDSLIQIIWWYAYHKHFLNDTHPLNSSSESIYLDETIKKFMTGYAVTGHCEYQTF